MKVLVLLSSYNGEKFIKEQIDSILSQKDIEIGLIIRDDGSNDNTTNIISKYTRDNRILDIIIGENVGSASSFMILLKKAQEYIDSFDYFSFSDQDDVWLPEKLINAVRSLSAYGQNTPSLYCSNLIVVDESLRGNNRMWPQNKKKLSKGQSLVDFIGTGCTFVFNKEVVRGVNKRVPERIHMHDLWIFHICTFLGNVYYDSNAYILYRQHGDNVVGAKSSVKAKMKSWLHSLRMIRTQHERQIEARTFLNMYEDVLTFDDVKLVRLVACARYSYWERFRWMLSIGYPYRNVRMVNWFENILFKFRILIGCY